MKMHTFVFTYTNILYALIFNVNDFNHSLIKNSEHLVEVDINGNAIGEQCAVKILEALKDRKKGRLLTNNV